MEKGDSVHSAVMSLGYMQTIKLAINECIICNKFVDSQLPSLISLFIFV